MGAKNASERDQLSKELGGVAALGCGCPSGPGSPSDGRIPDWDPARGVYVHSLLEDKASNTTRLGRSFYPVYLAAWLLTFCAFEPCVFRTHVSSRRFPRFGAQMRFWNFLMRKQKKAIEHRNIPNAFSRARKTPPVAPHSPIAWTQTIPKCISKSERKASSSTP